jgi:hypothetical protein
MVYFFDCFLTSPILDTPYQVWQRAWDGTPSRDDPKHFLRLCEKVRDIWPGRDPPLWISPREYPQILRSAAHEVSGGIKEHASLALSRAMMSSLEESLSRRLKEPIDLRFKVLATSFTSQYLSRAMFYSDILYDYRRRRLHGYPLQSGTTSATTWASNGEVFVYRDPVCGLSVMTADQMRAMKDCLLGRALVDYSASSLYPAEFSRTIDEHYKWQESVLMRYGNAGYEISKGTESLARTYLPRILADPVSGHGDSYDDMVQKILNKERALDPSGDPPLVLRYESVLQRCANPQEVCELFGLQKLHLHPTVDPVKGGRTSAAAGLAPDRTLYKDNLDTRNVINALVLQSYVRRHQAWPPFDVPPVEGTMLHRLWSARSTNITRTSYPLHDWDAVIMGKFLEYDMFPNWTELMDDKSLANEYQDRSAPWDRGAPPRTHRRLILEMLARYTVDPEAVAAEIERGNFRQAWRIICLKSKEREFKLSARMFAMLVFEIRLLLAMNQANLGDSLFPYLPEITMTMSKDQVRDRFLALLKPGSTGVLHLFLELDLSSWNLRWRQLLIGMITSDISRWFGKRRIFNTHVIFFLSQIIVRERFLRPAGIEQDPPPQSDLAWTGHLGGFEGLMQKEWSVATVGMIDRAMRNLEVAYKLTIQGDNVTNAIEVPRSDQTFQDQARSLAQAVLLETEVRAAEVGQLQKPEECCYATKCISYSKDFYVELPGGSAEIFLTLKFHSRLFPSVADDFPGIGPETTAVFASAQAGAERSAHPLFSYYIALVSAGLHLYSEGVMNGLDWGAVELGLTLPTALGGWALGPLDFLYKGGGDPLTKTVGSLLTLGTPCALRVLTYLESFPGKKEGPRFEDLLNDPYSIPLDKPRSAVQVVQQTAKSIVLHASRNHEVRELLSLDTSGYRDALIQDLSAVRPLNPLILSDVLACSLSGVADSLSRQFTATRTVQALDGGADPEGEDTRMISAVISASAGQVAWMCKMAKDLPGRMWSPVGPRPCYTLAESARSRWLAFKPACVTSYGLMDFEISSSHADLGLSVASGHLPYDPWTTSGPGASYTGSSTWEKRSEHGYRILQTGLPAAALRRLHSVAELSGSPELDELLDRVSLSRSESPVSSLVGYLPGYYGGNSAHRYAARMSERGARGLGTGLFSTSVSVNTDMMPGVSASPIDYPVMVQELSVGLLALFSLLPPRSGRVLKLLVTSDHLEALPDEKLRMTVTPTTGCSRLLANRLAYLPDPRLVRILGQPPAVLHALKAVSIESAMPSAVCALNALGFRAVSWPDLDVKLDVIEVSRVGTERVLRALATGIARGVLRIQLAQARRRLLERAARLLARALLDPMRHPLMRSERDAAGVASWGVRQPRQPTEDWLVFRLTSKVLPLLANPKILLGIPMVVLQDDRPSCAIDAIESIVAIGNEAAVNDGWGTFWIPPLIDDRSSSRGLLQSRAWAGATTASMVKFSANVHASALQQALSRCGSVGHSFEELLRRARQLPEQADTIVSDQTAERSPYTERLDTPRAVTIGDVISAIGRREDGLRSRYERCRGVSPAFGAFALTTLSHIPLEETRGRTVLCVGVGMGASAAISLSRMATRVYGVELASDLPLESAHFRDFEPPLVRRFGGGNRFSFLRACYSGTGDIRSPEVRKELATLSVGLVIWDVFREDGALDVSLLVEGLREYRGRVVLRAKTSSHWPASEAAGTLCSLGAATWAIQVGDPTNGHVLVGLDWEGARRATRGTTPLEVAPHWCPRLFRSKQDALTRCFPSYPWVLTTKESMESVLADVSALMTTSDRREGYEAWSARLYQAVCAHFLASRESQRLIALANLRGYGYILRLGRGSSIRVEYSEALARLLCVSVASLVSS